MLLRPWRSGCKENERERDEFVLLAVKKTKQIQEIAYCKVRLTITFFNQYITNIAKVPCAFYACVHKIK